MIRDLLITFAMLQPVYWEAETHPWGGKQVRAFNQDGAAVEVTFWPEVCSLNVALGYRGKWLKVWRLW